MSGPSDKLHCIGHGTGKAEGFAKLDGAADHIERHGLRSLAVVVVDEDGDVVLWSSGNSLELVGALAYTQREMMELLEDQSDGAA